MDACIGEIRLLPYTFAPQGWLACNGGLYDLRNYQALYAVIGNYFGGSLAQNTFAVPDLRSRVMVAAGNDPTDTFDPPYATSGGYEQVSLTTSTVPPHTHALTGANVKAASRVASPTGNYVGPLSTDVPVADVVINNQAFTVVSGGGYPPQPVLMNSATVSPFVGGTAGHENRQPYLAMQFCINWDGWFPVRP